ncbi:MAG: diguanylate cyclase [Pseudobdellovibrio sp.]
MKIKDYAADFTVFVLSQDADLGSRVKLTLARGHYETFFFADFDEMFERVKEAPPHIIVVDHEALIDELSIFFDKTLKCSSEIRIILMTKPEQFPLLTDYKEFNLAQFFDRDSAAVSFQVLNCVDQVCENLFRLYQNEQLFELYQTKGQELAQLYTDVGTERLGPTVRPFQMRITNYKLAESKEELLQKFFLQTPNQSWVFLKYIKSIKTYIAVAHQNMEENWVEGLSFKIPNDEAEFNNHVLVGDYPESLIQYLKDRWNIGALKIIPLILKDQIEGLLITPQDISAEVAEDFSLMSLVYQMLSLEAQPLHLDVEDSLTGFYNQLFYKRILDKEIDRSKRTFAPISVVKVSIDAFRELEVSQGRPFCDEIIKKIAAIIQNTSRLPDYACRTKENEFSLVLTNCNRRGAALRAERLRQVLKTESFSKSGFVITVSQGISEYPSLTENAVDLDESSIKALNFISLKGGDKICIYKAPVDHKPDFQVNV